MDVGADAPEIARGSAIAAVRLGPILAVSVMARDVELCAAAYRNGLDWHVVGEGAVAADEAAAWSAPALAGNRWIHLAAPSRRGGGVRFVEDRRCMPPSPLRTLGWAAAELAATREGQRAATRDGAFRILGGPAPLGSNPEIVATQVVGPAGEVFYLTDTRTYDGTLRLLRPQCDVDGVFIAVLACADMSATRAFYESNASIKRATDHDVNVAVLNAAHDLPAGARHRVSSLQLQGESLIEIDRYPSGAPARSLSPARAPQGLATVSIAVDHLEKLMATGRPFAAQHHGGRAAVIVRGAGGELLELVGI